ncbi:MAG: OmpA family protein [Clostridia bacterium]|nr:OmpA family protein [Clostridia bacterium]
MFITKRKIIALALTLIFLLSLCACGGKKDNYSVGTLTEDGKLVWYFGGDGLFSADTDVESYFEGIDDTVDPASIYSSLEFTEEMIYGSYTLNNSEKDIDKVREDIPFEEVNFKDGALSVSSLPVAVFFGADHVCNSETSYNYGDFQDVKDIEVAVIKLATKDKVGTVICSYELNGNSVTFKQLEQNNKAGEDFSYEYTGVEFTYNFELCGPYFTFSKGTSSLQLKAFCFTENVSDKAGISGYSLIDSPLIDELDYFASSENWNYAVRRDGSYYDTSAYKMTDDGIFTAYLSDKPVEGEEEVFTNQYAYIIQSDASAFFNTFGIILLDGEKQYYYTDDITAREARTLEDQGVDVSGLTEEKIKEIAEKKSDLFDDLYNEFETQGINVTVNRSTGEIAMDSSVLFGGDSALLNDEGKQLLDKFLAAYTSIIYSEKYDGFITKTMVEGHIAPIAGSTYESGLPLSEERANNVKDYCVSSETDSRLSSTLEAVGLSNTKPIYDANGEVDLAACRRVSFRFLVNIEE